MNSSFSTRYCLCFKQIDDSFLDDLLTLNKSKKLIAILLTLGQVSHFAGFGKVKLLGWLLLRWLLLRRLLLRWLLLGWLFLPFSLCETPLGETACLVNPYFLLTGSLSIQVFGSPLTQSVRPPMATYASLCSTCMTYWRSCHAIGHQVLPTQPLPREVEDFPGGGNHSRHMSLLTYLAWLQPICYNPKFVFIFVKTAKALLVVNTSIKNIEQQLHESAAMNLRFSLIIID